MIIDQNLEKKLLTFNDKEDVYKQFEKKVASINKIVGLKINANDYKLQYEVHEASIGEYMNLQRQFYETIHNKYPNLSFGMSGRLKSPFSHYEKTIRKFIDLIKKDEFRNVEIFDDYAIKVFILSIDYPIDKVSIDSEGIYIDSGTDEFRLEDFSNDEEDVKDVFEFTYEGKKLDVLVEKGQLNVSIVDNIPYICTNVNEKTVTLPLNTAEKFKRSCKEDLVPYCYSIQKEAEEFYNSNGFATKKRKDYISRKKESGYSSLQCSFYSEEHELSLECQIRTADMEKFNNMEREYGYKPNEKQISTNSLSKIPRFVLTTLFEDGVHNYAMTDAECFEYVYGMSLKEYRKQLKQAMEER